MRDYQEKCRSIRMRRPRDAVAGNNSTGLDRVLMDLAGQVESKIGKSMDPNPLFIWHGYEESTHVATLKYLQHRKHLNNAGLVTGLLGSGIAVVSVVNVVAIGQGLNALGATGKHLEHFLALAEKFKRSDTLKQWLGLLIRMKTLKASLRSGELALTVSGLCGTGAIAATIALTIAKFGSQAKLKTLCNFVAMHLHWRAFQETILLRGAAGTGPATRILQELFTRRSLTQHFGEHNVAALIREPGGWMAIADKLLLI